MFIMRSNMSLRNFASLITGNYVNVAMNNIKLNSKGNLKIPIAFTIIEDKQPLSMWRTVKVKPFLEFNSYSHQNIYFTNWIIKINVESRSLEFTLCRYYLKFVWKWEERLAHIRDYVSQQEMFFPVYLEDNDVSYNQFH